MFRETPILHLEVFSSCYYPLSQLLTFFLGASASLYLRIGRFYPPSPALGEGKVFFSFVCFIFIEVQLVFNSVIVSGVQQSDSVIYIYIYHFMGNRWGNSGSSVRLSFFGLQNHCRW